MMISNSPMWVNMLMVPLSMVLGGCGYVGTQSNIGDASWMISCSPMCIGNNSGIWLLAGRHSGYKIQTVDGLGSAGSWHFETEPIAFYMVWVRFGLHGLPTGQIWRWGGLVSNWLVVRWVWCRSKPPELPCPIVMLVIAATPSRKSSMPHWGTPAQSSMSLNFTYSLVRTLHALAGRGWAYFAAAL